MAPSKWYFQFPQAATAWLIRKVGGWLVVKLSAAAVLTVMVARMANPRRLGSAGGAVDGDDLGFWVSHIHVLCNTVKNLPSRLNSMLAGG
jgi:hypothetical protein